MRANECTRCDEEFSPPELPNVINFKIDEVTGQQVRYYAEWCDDCFEEKQAETGVRYE